MPDASPAERGLTSAGASRLRAEFGANAMPDTSPHPGRLAIRKLWAPVPWMLESAIVLELILARFVEASVIGSLLLFNAILGFVQENRSQATLAALKSRLALEAAVRRDGSWQVLPASALVPGDIVKLSLGGIVAADVRLLSGKVLLDESMLTGESMPVEAGPGHQTFSGCLVLRGESVAIVTATGTKTKFGRTAQLVGTAHATSSQQVVVLHVVRNLAVLSAGVIVILVAYACYLRMPVTEIVPLVLAAILASIPVALPATFTLAAAVGARNLAARGVLPTRLSAMDEAGQMSVLCVDKTGTLTQNRLTVTDAHPMPGIQPAELLTLAALASSDGGQDPVDRAIRTAAATGPRSDSHTVRFVPFDPATKMSAATVTDASGTTQRIVKGAFASVLGIAPAREDASVTAHALEARGYRVLAVAAGPPGSLKLVGLIALSDPPRPDAATLITELRTLGVRTVMITGDAPVTASIVAHLVGLDGATYPPGPIADHVDPGAFAVFAGVLPEDKYRLVKAFQARALIVGMCGDGANDAPALRQAQVGVAVSTATDVARSAAGIVLTEPGLAGIVAAVREGRVIFQRILTYILNSITSKITQVLFVVVGLILSGHAILTPLLMALIMITGDFLGMALTTDVVRPSARPNVWDIRKLMLAGGLMGTGSLAFCLAVLETGMRVLHLDATTLQSLAFVTLVFAKQATTYVTRERRRLWSSRPSYWLMASSCIDLCIASTLALGGIAMAPLPARVVLLVLAAAAGFALLLDLVKGPVFRRLAIA